MNEIVDVDDVRRQWISRDELIRRLSEFQADPGVRADLAALDDDPIDDAWRTAERKVGDKPSTPVRR